MGRRTAKGEEIETRRRQASPPALSKEKANTCILYVPTKKRRTGNLLLAHSRRRLLVDRKGLNPYTTHECQISATLHRPRSLGAGTSGSRVAPSGPSDGASPPAQAPADDALPPHGRPSTPRLSADCPVAVAPPPEPAARSRGGCPPTGPRCAGSGK